MTGRFTPNGDIRVRVGWVMGILLSIAVAAFGALWTRVDAHIEKPAHGQGEGRWEALFRDLPRIEKRIDDLSESLEKRLDVIHANQAILLRTIQQR